jgi:hypothetical protein
LEKLKNIEVSLVQAAVSCECCSTSFWWFNKQKHRQAALDYLGEHSDRLEERQIMGAALDDEDFRKVLDFVSSMSEDCLLCSGKDRVISQTVRSLLDSDERPVASKRGEDGQLGNIFHLPGTQKEH